MKKLALTLLLILFIQNCVDAQVTVFSSDNKFGLKDSANNIVAPAKYKKMIRLGKTAWIMQSGNKFGIIHDSGKILVEPSYIFADRILGKYVKFKKGDKYGIFDEMGFEVLPVEYSSIDLLYGGMFVTSRKYKCGIADLNGQIILDNIFDDIYMPNPNTLVLVYNNKTIEVKKEKGVPLIIPADLYFTSDSDVSISDITSSPIATTGYYGIALTDYILKIFSSISPAYEQTIDELMYSKGADSVSIIMKCSWIPKFPFIYAKKYYQNFSAPFNGPLSQIKRNIKQNIKN